MQVGNRLGPRISLQVMALQVIFQSMQCDVSLDLYILELFC